MGGFKKKVEEDRIEIEQAIRYESAGHDAAIIPFLVSETGIPPSRLKKESYRDIMALMNLIGEQRRKERQQASKKT